MSNFEIKYKMKKILLLLLLLGLTGCKEQKPKYYLDNPLMKAKVELAEKEKNKPKNEDILFDLTKISGIIADSQLTKIINESSKYLGNKIRIKGTYSYYKNPQTNSEYHNCIFKSSCCSKGLEFVLKEGEYPENGQEVIIEGNLNSYMEDGHTYYNLIDAKWLK